MRKLFRLTSRENQPAAPLVLHNPPVETERGWLSLSEEEGQLSVDIYQTEDELVVKSTIAGATAQDIEISLVDDMLTIRGQRELEEEVGADAYLYRECYWGRFSRSIILPVEVKHDKVAASLHNGVLTIRLPKAKRSKQLTIRVRDSK